MALKRQEAGYTRPFLTGSINSSSKTKLHPVRSVGLVIYTWTKVGLVTEDDPLPPVKVWYDTIALFGNVHMVLGAVSSMRGSGEEHAESHKLLLFL